MDVDENSESQTTNASCSFARGEYVELRTKQENQFGLPQRFATSDLSSPEERSAVDLQKHQPSKAIFSSCIGKNTSKSLGKNQGCRKKIVSIPAVLGVIIFGFITVAIVLHLQQQAELKAGKVELCVRKSERLLYFEWNRQSLASW